MEVHCDAGHTRGKLCMAITWQGLPCAYLPFISSYHGLAMGPVLLPLHIAVLANCSAACL